MKIFKIIMGLISLVILYLAVASIYIGNVFPFLILFASFLTIWVEFIIREDGLNKILKKEEVREQVEMTLTCDSISYIGEDGVEKLLKLGSYVGVFSDYFIITEVNDKGRNVNTLKFDFRDIIRIDEDYDKMVMEGKTFKIYLKTSNNIKKELFIRAFAKKLG